MINIESRDKVIPNPMARNPTNLREEKCVGHKDLRLPLNQTVRVHGPNNPIPIAVEELYMRLQLSLRFTLCLVSVERLRGAIQREIHRMLWVYVYVKRVANRWRGRVEYISSLAMMSSGKSSRVLPHLTVPSTYGRKSRKQYDYSTSSHNYGNSALEDWA